MTFSNIDSLQLGNLLQIVFSSGVRNQLSKNYREWEQVKRWRVGSTQARELRFMVQSSYGPAAIQYRNPGTSGRAFPSAQQSTTSEHTAKFKEINATIELEWNLYDRALSSPEKYAEPLALEIQNKTTGSRRRIAADFYGDGTGVVGTAVSVSDSEINTSGKYRVTVTLSDSDTARGGVGMFEFGDLLLCKQAAGTARTPTGGSNFAAYRVKLKNRKLNKVTLELVDSSGALVSGYTASGIVDGDLFYRIGQPTIPDLSSTVSADYGTLTEVFAGLETLAASDGRLIHGMTMEGALAGTEVDAGTDALDANMIQEALDTVKVNVGADEYKWAKMCMAPENHAKLINSRETDRRFTQVTDNKRGIKYFAYIHENDEVAAYTSEFVSKKRIWGLPENQDGKKKVFEYYGSDYKPIKMPGSGEFHLKPASGGSYVNMVQSFLHGILVLVCKHPAAVWKIRNFT